MKRFYVDTNIWLDFALDRKDGVRPLGEFAFQFLKKCIRNKWRVFCSDAVLSELGEKMPPDQIEERCFKIVSEQKLLERVRCSGRQVAEAEAVSKNEKLPFVDALHAIIARDNNAVVVSRDWHFERLLKKVKVLSPEEI